MSAKRKTEPYEPHVIQKGIYIRSRKLLDSSRGQVCTLTFKGVIMTQKPQSPVIQTQTYAGREWELRHRTFIAPMGAISAILSTTEGNLPCYLILKKNGTSGALS